ncbi:MAG: tyrosine-type recombinase/integrase [Actinobacteria bacterium]|nr:tyrosine-type recombinase/integrase [Actinomycetota bacterium]
MADSRAHQPEQPLAIQSQIDQFLEAMAGKSPATRQTYGKSLKRFTEFLRESGTPAEALAADLPPEILERFHGWLVDGYGRDRRATITTYVAGTRAFFRFLARRRLLSPETSFEQIRAGLQEVMGKGSYKTPRIDRRLPLVILYVNRIPIPPPTPENREKRLEILRDKAILHALFASGMRREEISRLNRQDVNDGYSAQALITGKGDKERVVFFTEEALEAIRVYLGERADRHAPLFIRHDARRGKPAQGGQNYRLTPFSIWRIVKEHAALAGVDVTTHDFRHAKASVMLNRGAKLSEVQDILGHSSPETTKKIYAHYEVSHLRSAFDRFSASAEELVAEMEPSARQPRRLRRPSGEGPDPAAP